ncbi:thioredoxin domain-containing protein 15-like isoform X2 [Sipha flava]|uniref:Thioredoxin domain-containing protein 15-like isoform X2 n=1 Tax=Sipha flava TaxID=143950 RepID=A0A8B8FGL2_9HEMI|nr:thioredoxin domain-containing protein 15-like isoform X2 [Sipha flava]
MYFSNILSFLSYCGLVYAEYEENIHIDDSKFGPLEAPDSPKNLSTIPQKKLEKEHNYLPTMQAYLTTSTASNGGKDFKFSSFLSSVLYAELITDNTNTSLPSINEPLANVTVANNSRIVNCTGFVPLNQTEVSVEVVNSTRLGYVLKSDPEINNRQMPAVCSLVLFYARSCQFSILAAPHFNVLPRIFPQIKMVAFNAISEQRYNTMYGIIGVPSLVLFHNGKPIAKYNGSDYSLYEFTKFVIRHTDLPPKEKVEISVADFVKPVPGFGNHDYDYSLWLAWFVIIFWTLYYVRTMNFWRKCVEDIKNIWREAEAQHEHAD